MDKKHKGEKENFCMVDGWKLKFIQPLELFSKKEL